MIRSIIRRATRGKVAVLGALCLTATVSGVGLTMAASAGSDPQRPIAVNQTDGYGQGTVGAFTYFQNYACVHQPFDDLDGDGAVAAEDPDEFDTPRCVVGTQPSIDPAGKPARKTEPLFVLVPFFDADNDGAAAGGLAQPLKDRFGMVPDAFDPTPGVPVQCPEPGQPLTQHKGAFGTCTLHPTTLDLDPVLKSLGIAPVGGKLPLVNHSHLIRKINFKAVWWQIRPVLVTDPSVWPDVAGTKGITSVSELRAAQAAGKAFPDVPSNFHLFFNSRELAYTH